MGMAIDAVVGDVEFAAYEPLGPGGIPFQYFLPWSEPVEVLGLGSPEGLWIAQGPLVDGRVVGIGLPAKILSRRESSPLVEQSGQAFLRSRRHHRPSYMLHGTAAQGGDPGFRDVRQSRSGCQCQCERARFGTHVGRLA